MKFTRFAMVLFIALFVCGFLVPLTAYCETVERLEPAPANEDPDAISEALAMSEAKPPDEPFTWAYLATIAGAAAFTLIVVQLCKVPLDKVWHIPTRLLVYIICLLVMLAATHFTVGLGWENGLLAAVNAFIAALTAYGAYELTFAKTDRR